MFRDRRAQFLLLVLALTVETQIQAQSGAAATLGGGAPAEIVGRWVLIASIRNGEDVTQAGDALVYDFKADGTCLFPPSESNTRPAKCESKQENRSSIYIMKREAR